MFYGMLSRNMATWAHELDTLAPYIMAIKYFTTETPPTLFNTRSMAKLARCSRATILKRWHSGAIQATALDATSKPLFSINEAAKINATNEG